MKESKLIFERSSAGRSAYRLAETRIPQKKIETLVPNYLLREKKAQLPEVSEPDVVRHYTLLSHRNHCVDSGFYPLGSCTMKYNPKINDEVAALSKFTTLHPLQPDKDAQGILELLFKLLEALCEITGMDWGSLQPFAGAHGEFTGMKLFRALFNHRGEQNRKKILIPDSAHGTNPASAHIAGFEVHEVPSDSRGLIDPRQIREHLGPDLAGIMLTNPNTLGLFEQDVGKIAEMVHGAGGQLYYDGANLNAVLGKCRPGDMGFDVVHLNLHKTFSTPHGGGGPGAGPVLVKKHLIPFLPKPDISKTGNGYRLLYNNSETIGRISGFYGNIGVMVRAYAYLLTMGGDGLQRASELAVLNANYLKERLKPYLKVPFDAICKHEFVLSAAKMKETYGVTAMDFAKTLLDFGIHPPTVYFPVNVPEALMIEPTETETLETLNEFIQTVQTICELAENRPEHLHSAPHNAVVGRIDEVRAARHPILRWKEGDN